MNEPSTHFSPLIWTIYGVIILYFALGATGFYLINRKKPTDVARKSYLKFLVYFLIINLLFWCIVLFPGGFPYLVIAIVLLGIWELSTLFVRSGFKNLPVFLLSLLVLISFGFGFYRFSLLSSETMLYVFLIVSIFDSFSQITGQLWGKKKIVPTISPNKTYGGVIGGFLVAVLSAFLLMVLHPEMSFDSRLIYIIGLVAFAFIGDLLASWYKRVYGVKDYSLLIPGHGGILDRFDSLIAAAAWASVCLEVPNILF